MKSDRSGAYVQGIVMSSISNVQLGGTKARLNRGKVQSGHSGAGVFIGHVASPGISTMNLPQQMRVTVNIHRPYTRPSPHIENFLLQFRNRCGEIG